MARKYTYPALFRKQPDGRVLVRFPDFSHALTDGANAQEAMEEAIDCLGTVLAGCIVNRKDVPVASPMKRGWKEVPVPFWIAGKLALYQAMQEQRISNSELARRLGVRETIVRRMLDPDHDTRSEKLQAALLALGTRVVVTLQDAA